VSAPALKSAQLALLPEVGDVLDRRFEISKLLGEGGMGHVFEAYDRRLDRKVALKLLAVRYLGRREREERIFREAELMRRVGRHPHLVQALDDGRLENHGWPYLVMTLIEGESLAAQLAFEGALSPSVATRLADQVARAVLVLHRAGVVHRDVTASNILIRGGNAVLIDLSHAGDLNAPQVQLGEVGRLTQPHEVPGTHHYMSREQAKAQPAHPAMDVYAFGVTMVHMLTGVAPRGEGREQFIEKQRLGLVESPRVDIEMHPKVPLALAALANACTDQDATLRPTMDEVVIKLGVMVSGKKALGRARPSRVPVVVEMKAAPVVALPEGSDDERRDGHRSYRGLALVFGVLLLLAIAGLFWMWSRIPQPRADAGAREIEPVPDAVVVVVPEVEPEPASAEPAIEVPEPKPQLDPKRSRAKRTKKAAKTTPAPCVDPAPRVQRALEARSWSEVLRLTAKGRCWSSSDLRWSSRAMALYRLERYEECLAAARRSTGAPSKRMIAMCSKATKATGLDR